MPDVTSDPGLVTGRVFLRMQIRSLTDSLDIQFSRTDIAPNSSLFPRLFQLLDLPDWHLRTLRTFSLFARV